MRMYKHGCCLIVALLLPMVAVAQICVVASDRLGVHHLNRSQVASIYQGKPTAGVQWAPIDLPSNSSTYQRFYHQVLGWNAAQVNTYWSGQVFGGGGSQPQTADSSRQAIEAVLQNPGAVAYVNTDSASLSGLNRLYCFGPTEHHYRPTVHHQSKSHHSPESKSSVVHAHHNKSVAPVDHKATVVAKQKVVLTAKPQVKATQPTASQQASVNAQVIGAAHVVTANPSVSDVASTDDEQPSLLDRLSSVISQMDVGSLINHQQSNAPVAADTTTSAAKVAVDSSSSGNDIPLLFSNTQSDSADLFALPQAKTASQAHNTQKAGSLWPVLVQHFGMDDSTSNPRVKAEVAWYLRHKDLLQVDLQNSALYLYYVYQQTHSHGVPAEFALLPIVESNFDPYAYSRVGATGLWQMMPGTAVSYSLDINWWYDGRADVMASTNAALNYIKRLGHAYNNWDLAAAAYNVGGGSVSSARHRNRTKGLPDDYWHLRLPTETMRYVPKLLALANIIAHAHQYGVTLPAIANAPYFTPVKMKSQIELIKAAHLAGISPQLMHLLNPGFRRFATTSKGQYTLLIPSDHEKQFRDNLSAISGQEQRTWIYHEARAHEDLPKIAHDYHTSVALLQKVNGLTGTNLALDQGVLVPLSLHRHYTPALSPVTGQQSMMYGDQLPVAKQIEIKVGRDDTLLSLATKYNVTAQQIQHWNHLSVGASLKSGKTVVVWLVGDDNATSFGHQKNKDAADKSLANALNMIYKSQ